MSERSTILLLARRALRALAARGCGIVITGHEIRTPFDVSNDVVWMMGGTTHAPGTPAEALDHHAFRRDDLGPGASRSARNREYTSSA